MKKPMNFLFVPAMLFGCCACREADRDMNSRNSDKASLNWDKPFISAASADTLVKSYLTSIDYQSEDSNVRSFIIDANALRQYLTYGRGQQISHLKLMLAHSADHIRSGRFGQPCGYNGDALTVVLAGYGDDGNYIYAPGNRVMDYSMPCPENCPKSGTAASDRLPN